MLALYLAALCFGGIPILVSLLFGGVDKDFDKDLDKDFDKGGFDKDFESEVDVDADADADADADGEKDLQGSDSDFSAWWLLSMRFWTFGFSAFGLAGTLLTLLSVPGLAALVTSVVLGLVIGYGAARFFRALSQDHVSGDTELGRYVGEEAKVLLPIRPGQQGKITVSTLAGRVELPATSRDELPLDVGSRVIVAAVHAGVADVSGLSADGERRRLRQAAARKEHDV